MKAVNDMCAQTVGHTSPYYVLLLLETEEIEASVTLYNVKLYRSIQFNLVGAISCHSFVPVLFLLQHCLHIINVAIPPTLFRLLELSPGAPDQIGSRTGTAIVIFSRVYGDLILILSCCIRAPRGHYISLLGATFPHT